MYVFTYLVCIICLNVVFLRQYIAYSITYIYFIDRLPIQNNNLFLLLILSMMILLFFRVHK